jgi:hypothetical protein
MNENINNQLDNLAKKVIQKSKIKSPSYDFTSNIMSQITALQEQKISVYQPLISKKYWIAISTGFLALLAFLIFGTETESLNWFSSLDFSILTENKLTETLSDFTVSKTLMYAIVFFGLAWFVQIGLLKNYFNKRLEY